MIKFEVIIIRLDKFLSNQGLGTRSEIKKYILRSNVKVNDVVVKKADLQIDPEKDIVSFLNVNVQYSEFTYIMLNKPANVISATADKLHKTVIDLLDKKLKNLKLFPVGRLDIDTEGLVILTNNGKFAHNTLSPKKHVTKKYFVEVAGFLTKEDKTIFNDGIIINGDYKCKPATLDIISSDEISLCYVTITEGKFHQIKKMFFALDKKVLYLQRVSFGGITLDEKLKPGDYRPLTDEELVSLEEYL